LFGAVGVVGVTLGCYPVRMPTKGTSVRSIRLADETWAELSAEAEKRQTSVNALVAGFIEDGLEPDPVPDPAEVRKVTQRLVAEATKHTLIPTLGVPVLQRKAFNPQPKKGSKK
jgi:hypothetical protein